MLSNIKSAQAAKRPLAGFGAGAFTCDGVRVGSRATESAAAPALPRIRRAAAAISQGQAQGGYVGAAHTTGLIQATTEQFKQMTRVNPVVPGGLGPHPAGEPEPV